MPGSKLNSNQKSISMCLSKSIRHMWHLEMSVHRRKNAHRTFSGLEPNFHSDFYTKQIVIETSQGLSYRTGICKILLLSEDQ